MEVPDKGDRSRRCDLRHAAFGYQTKKRFKMIKCKSKYAHGCECVIDMSSAELIGGSICCDTAEDLNFNREKILNCCKYAEHVDIKNADLKELLS